VSAGAAAVVLAQIPTRLVRLQRIDGSVQAELQQTLSAQESALQVVAQLGRTLGRGAPLRPGGFLLTEEPDFVTIYESGDSLDDPARLRCGDASP
jgi:hypothetical protein